MSNSVKETVLKIVADQALVGVEDVAFSHSLEDLGIDSIAVVEMIFEIEEALDLQIPFNANTPEQSGFDLTSIATVIAAVEKLVADKPK